MSNPNMAPQAPTLEAQLAPVEGAMQRFAGRLGAGIQSGRELISEIPRNIKAMAAVGSIAVLGLTQGEAASAAEPESVALGNMPVLTGGTAAPNSLTPSVGPAIEVSNGIHYLASDSGVENSSADASDIELLQQQCSDAALVEPVLLSPPKMYHAGVRPLNSRHLPSQIMRGTFVYPEVPEECDDAFVRTSGGQVQMQKRDKPSQWMNIAAANNPAYIGNREGRSTIFFGPGHDTLDYMFNECNNKGKFQKVRILLTNYLKTGENRHRSVVEEKRYVLPVKVQGNCSTAKEDL